MVCCCDATASSFVAKVWAKSSHIFTQSLYEVMAVCGNDCSAWQAELFMNTLLISKKLLNMLLTLLFTCLGFFVLVSLNFPCMAHPFFPETQGLWRFACCPFVGSIAKSHQAG
jgi:hypothetical protein